MWKSLLYLLAGVGIGCGFMALASSRALTPLAAVATHGSDSVAIATMPFDSDGEAFVALDALTADLTVSVIHPAMTKVRLQGKVNVMADLGLAKGKKPNLLMVTGAKQFKGLDKPAAAPCAGTIYVCEASTGRWVVYGMAYNKGLFNAGEISALHFSILDAGRIRSVELE